eukprot:TRINITY_DN9276_c0_g1_i1.p1 TRINITY_DN9276_c0_g1~~TRINITY_DN9276_c0_g1_i1.p1  ORF type:complete len:184 (+),score=38.17 TRINITY_DN9276_c0_g1_i1:71-622(+)
MAHGSPAAMQQLCAAAMSLLIALCCILPLPPPARARTQTGAYPCSYKGDLMLVEGVKVLASSGVAADGNEACSNFWAGNGDVWYAIDFSVLGDIEIGHIVLSFKSVPTQFDIEVGQDLGGSPSWSKYTTVIVSSPTSAKGYMIFNLGGAKGQGVRFSSPAGSFYISGVQVYEHVTNLGLRHLT